MATKSSVRPQRSAVFRHLHLGARICIWVFGIPSLLLLLLYARLLFGPLDVSFATQSAEDAVRAAIPENSELTLGSSALALDRWMRPVVQFSDVVLTDTGTGSTIRMDGLNVGFSPLFALFGQPGITLTLIGPHIQSIHGLLGARLAQFDSVENANGTTVVVHQGDSAYPEVAISPDGLIVKGTLPKDMDASGIKSDNETMVEQFESVERNLDDMLALAQQGKFSHLRIIDGTVETLDTVRGLYKKFENVDLDLVPAYALRPTHGTFAGTLSGRRTTAKFERTTTDDGTAHIDAEFENIDFSALLSFLDSDNSFMAVKGGGRLGMKVSYSPKGKLLGATFDIDAAGTQIRVKNDYYPVEQARALVDWLPDKARYNMHESRIVVGKTSALVSGVFLLGLDDVYGPTLSMSMTARQLYLQPNDMAPTSTPFTEMKLKAWSAPLYGAIGIDNVTVTKPGVQVSAHGRFDMLSDRAGMQMEIDGKGASVDDMKRLWPYIFSGEARDWFVQNVKAGELTSGTLKFDFPVGTLSVDNEDLPIPKGGISIDMAGTGVTFVPLPGMEPIPATGTTKLTIRDHKTSVALEGGTVKTAAGDVEMKDGAVLIDTSDKSETVFEISGDVDGDVPSSVDLLRSQAPDVVEQADVPIDLDALRGDLSGSLVATIVRDNQGEVKSFDYAAHGKVSGFTSTQEIADRKVTNGELSFSATPSGYHIAGTAEVDGLNAELVLDGAIDKSSELRVASTIDASEFKKLGFDVSDFINGNVRFVARPLDDGTMQVAIDLQDAAVTINDLGLKKPKGVAGTLEAAVTTDGEITHVKQINLNFGDVNLSGELDWHSEKGLMSAHLTNLALGPGDSASVDLEPTDTGYNVTVRGDQLDIKPMLKRYFALDQNSTGGPSASSISKTLNLDIELKRALGFYKVTAYNLDIEAQISGEDLQKVSLQGQFGENNTVSITTNPSGSNRVMSVAFNDLGTLLRFANVYPRLLGGAGSMVMTTDPKTKTDQGQLRIGAFSIVNESRIAEIAGNHEDSRKLIERDNRVDFSHARVTFKRTPDAIEVTEGLVNSDSIGGTVRGTIDTKDGQYNLVGTYVPLFALNNMFQKLPIIGDLLGVRNGEGLVGVTFAIRGPLNKPTFLVNPASILLPGVLRGLFEFREEADPDAATSPEQSQSEGN